MEELRLDSCATAADKGCDQSGSAQSTASASISSQHSHNVCIDTDSDDEFARADLGLLEKIEPYGNKSNLHDNNVVDDISVDDDEHSREQGSEASVKNLDEEAMSLLSEIFPDASREELEDLHYSRIVSNSVHDCDSYTSDKETEEGESDAHKNGNEVGSDASSMMDHPEEDEQSKIPSPVTHGNLYVDAENDSLGTEVPKVALHYHQTSPGNESIRLTRNEVETPSKEHSDEVKTPSQDLISVNQGNMNASHSPSDQREGYDEVSVDAPDNNNGLKKDGDSPKGIKQNEKGNGNQNATGTTQQAQFELADDFLRIPQHQALKLPNAKTGQKEWKIVVELEDYVIRCHVASAAAAHDGEFRRWIQSDQVILRTPVFSRDLYVGLGMQLRESEGFIYIGALICPNGHRIEDSESYSSAIESGVPWEEFGPAFTAGVKPGDRVLGVNGIPFLRWISQESNFASKNDGRHVTRALSSNEILANAANILRNVGDPIVLHILRDQVVQGSAQVGPPQSPRSPPRPIQNTDRDQDAHNLTKKADDVDEIHPLIQQFSKKGLVRSRKEKLKLTKELARSTKRASLWSANSYLRTMHFDYDKGFEGDERDRVVYPALERGYVRESLDFGFVRQGLNLHIVNTFVDKDRLVFTIWVFDVETRSEWYAPVRYFRDFEDLRTATSALNKAVDRLPFPAAKWFRGDDSGTSQTLRNSKISQLEDFLRGLCNLVYTNELGSSTSEIALYVQTFLGCDNQLMNERKEFLGNDMEKTRQQLIRAIQLYTYRILLLPTFKALIVRFVDDVKHRATLIEEKKTVTMNSSSTITEKEKIVGEVVTVKNVFANIWNLIMDGCRGDFDAIANSPEFGALHSVIIGEKWTVYKDTLYRDTIREQIEIEAYVPMRSTISRLLVQGWRYDDKIIAYKIKALTTKQQSFFKISFENQSPSGWYTVIDILRHGVGRSTLPCNKLKAIVNASKEIGRLAKEEHPQKTSQSTLGADDFLPIFIYCVVNADIERPCALCK